jgi:hypothetical protein
MAVHTLTYGSKIWTKTKQNKTKKKLEAKIETAETVWSVACYTMKNHIRNIKIMEELNIFNLNNKILKLRSDWKYHVQ